MTIGIYALVFNDDKIYIGQSVDCEARFTRHIREMTKGTHYNYKILEAYNTYGKPNCVIIEECQIFELSEKEYSWIDEFDSARSGLNIRDEKDTLLQGPEANSARYSREQIIQVFNMLLDTKTLLKDISTHTGVPVGNINCISRGASHLWLKSEFPEKYAVLESNVGKRKGGSNTLFSRTGKYHPSITSPDGVVYDKISNLKKFCQDKGLDYTNIHKLTRGVKNKVCGWTRTLSP